MRLLRTELAAMYCRLYALRGAVPPRMSLVGGPRGLLPGCAVRYRRWHGHTPGERRAVERLYIWVPLVASRDWRTARLLPLRFALWTRTLSAVEGFIVAERATQGLRLVQSHLGGIHGLLHLFGLERCHRRPEHLVTHEH